MKNVYKPRIIAMICLLVLVAAACISGGFAKYTTQVKDEGPGETFEAKLFDGSFKLEEVKMEMQEDGIYDSVMEGETPVMVTENSYYMIPGTVLGKLPAVSYISKTNIPAYMYLKVEGSPSEANVFTYAMDDCWTALDGVDGVYVYSSSGTPVKLTGSPSTNQAIPVIKEGKVTIETLQKLAGEKKIQISAWALQAPGETATLAEAKTVWNRMDGGDKYLVDTTIRLNNTFKIGSVTASVEETYDGTTKSDVRIKNTGNVPALIRARLVVNWVDDAGNIIANPGFEDPTAGKIDTAKWTKLGDYYYYNGYVQPSTGDNAKSDGTEKTSSLLTSAITDDGSYAPYHLQIEVIAEAIQATGFVNPTDPNSDTAVYSAWKHKYTNGTWN